MNNKVSLLERHLGPVSRYGVNSSRDLGCVGSVDSGLHRNDSLVSAIVVSFNSEQDLPACLSSLQEAGLGEIIVVDNASADSSLRVARGHGVIVIPQQRNLGFAAACNIGATQAHAEFLLFINPDAMITRDALAQSLISIEHHGQNGVLGFLLTDVSGRLEKYSFGFKDQGLSEMFLRKIAAPRLPAKTTAVAWVSAGAMLVRRALFDRLQGFDSDFFMYWEDVDFCRRARQAGFKVLLEPGARVVHRRGASGASSILKTRHYDASADRYFQKHYAGTICFLHSWIRRIYRKFSPRAF